MNKKITVLSLVVLGLSGCQCDTDERSKAMSSGFADVEVGKPETVRVQYTPGESTTIIEEYPVEDITLSLSVPDRTQTYYVVNHYEVTPEYAGILEEWAQWLKANPSVRISVQGHCDERGTREYNIALGQRRADHVKDYLVMLGIEEARIETISYGKERPLVSGSNEEAWALNRTSVVVVQ